MMVKRARGASLALCSVHLGPRDDAVSIRQHSRQCHYEVEEQREQAASRCDAKGARDGSHRANLLLVDGGARACAARGRPAARTLAAPGAYAARNFSFWGFLLVDDAFARGDRVLGNQSRFGCLSSHITDRCASVSRRSIST